MSKTRFYTADNIMSKTRSFTYPKDVRHVRPLSGLRATSAFEYLVQKIEREDPVLIGSHVAILCI